MKIGFLLKRITYLKTMGSLIKESLMQGHEVFIFFIPNVAKGAKAYQNVSSEKLEALKKLGAEIVEIGMEELSGLGSRYGLDHLVTQEGFHSLNAQLGDLAALRKSGTRLVSLSHYFEIAQHPISALEHFDRTIYLSEYARDLHFELQVQEENRAPEQERVADLISTAGSPMFDPISKLKRRDIRANMEIDDEQKVVLYISPVISSSTPWRYSVLRDASRLSKSRDVLIAGKPGYLGEIWFGKSAQQIFEEIKVFCDRNDAMLIVKSRGKQADGSYLSDGADTYFNGFDDEYFPVFSTHTLLAASDLCITANSMAAAEAVAVGVPCLNIALPPHDRVGHSSAERNNYEEALLGGSPGSLMNYPGCVTRVERREIASFLSSKMIDQQEIDPIKREEYISEFLGIEGRSSSQRILEEMNS